MNPRLPKWALWFFHWYCKDPLKESILGDLEEQFEEDSIAYGSSRAKRRFVWNVIRFFRPGIYRSFMRLPSLLSSDLFFHYFKAAQRNLRKDKAYSLINLFGLTLAICVCLFIYQYVSLERNYDDFHQEVDDKFLVVQSTFQNEALSLKTSQTPHGLGAEAIESISGIKNLVRVRPIMADEGLVFSAQNGTNVFLEYDAWYVDPTFFQMFNFPLINGNESEALTDPNSIVISESMAQKYFGSENPMEQSIKISAGSLGGTFQVTGVMKDLPTNTHMKFDFLLPLDFLISNYGVYTRADGWSWSNFNTYVQLDQNADLALVGDQFDKLIQTHWGSDLMAQNKELITSFQPLKDIHLDDTVINQINANPNSEQNIWLFTFIGIIIMVVAWINGLNLSSARALRRIKEVGIRKSIGAYRNQLLSQFLIESLLLQLLSGFLAVGLTLWFMPKMESLLGIPMNANLFDQIDFVLLICAVILFGALLTGIYPCLMVLRLGSSSAISSQISFAGKRGGLRYSLLSLQLVISLLLFFFTYLIHEQVSFMSNKNIGVAMDQILVVHGPRVVLEEGEGQLVSRHHRFRNELLANPNIEAITGTTNVPGTGEIWSGDMYKSGEPSHEVKVGKLILVDQYFTDAYDFELLAGAPFRSGMRDYEAAIINESALAAFGLGTPEEALLESVVITGMDTLRVQAVVKNPHWYSLHEAHTPLVFGFVDMFNAYLSIKINTNNIGESLDFIEATYRDIYPTDPFNSYFLDRKYNEQYKIERQAQKLFGIFSIISILISCLGLFSLVSYSLHLKIKEIGVRKVLGASISSLAYLLAKSYIVILLFSSVIAIPIMVVGATKWLDDFPFRIAIGWHLFIIPILALAFLSMLTISHRILKVALINPVDYLRNE